MPIKIDRTNSILFALLIIDILFIVLHILLRHKYLESDYFRIAKDHSYAEFYQYIKFIAAGVILLYLAKTLRSFFVLVFALLAFFLFYDDAFRFHEHIGNFFLLPFFFFFLLFFLLILVNFFLFR